MCVFMDKYFAQVISLFFLLTDFNILAELLISCPVFQKCDAMIDLSVWFNLIFLKCSFVLVSTLAVWTDKNKCRNENKRTF
jgi:hypothetical protein